MRRRGARSEVPDEIERREWYSKMLADVNLKYADAKFSFVKGNYIVEPDEVAFVAPEEISPETSPSSADTLVLKSSSKSSEPDNNGEVSFNIPQKFTSFALRLGEESVGEN